MKEIIRCPFCNHACWRDSLCACIKGNNKKTRQMNNYRKKKKELTECFAKDCKELSKTQFCSKECTEYSNGSYTSETREEYKERIEKFRNRNK